MLETVFGNPHYKLASLILAVLAWLYVQSDQLLEEPVKAQVVWTVAPGLVSVDPLPSQISVRLRGTRAAIRRTRSADLRIDVDLADLGPGEHTLDFSTFQVSNLPGTLEVVGHAPTGIRFELDEVTERRVRVRPVVVGEPAPGYAVESVVLSPTVAAVRGPRVTIAGLAEIETEPIDLSGLAGNTTVPATLDLPRNLTQAAPLQPFSADVEILAQTATRTFAEVPVHVWEAGRYVAEPSTVQVTLTGPSVQLRELEAEALVAFVHLPLNPDKPRYSAAWGPEDGQRLRVLVGGTNRLQVTAVQPSSVEVTLR